MRPTIDLGQYDGYTPDGRGWFHVFTVEPCESCDQPAEGANAVHLHPRAAGEALFQAAGLGRYERRLPEQWYDEERGACVCAACTR